MTERTTPSTVQQEIDDSNISAVSPLQSADLKEEQEKLRDRANEEYQFLYWQ